MPELPEVETIRRDLQDVLVGDQIIRFDINLPKIVKGSASLDLLIGKSIKTVGRRAKLLVVDFEHSPYHLLIHLKMTGQLFWQNKNHQDTIAGGHTLSKWEDNFVLPNKYTHVVAHLKSGATLYFNDLRQFGYWQLADDAALAKATAGLGPEPLDPAFTLDFWNGLLARRPRSTIKAVLLDQKGISGVGNIYADEACFLAQVRPDRRVSTLTKVEIERLWIALPQILNLAIKHRGTTFNTFRDTKGRQGNFVSLLKVYGRGGQPCKRCKEGIIKKTTVAGRGTHFCPHCQK